MGEREVAGLASSGEGQVEGGRWSLSFEFMFWCDHSPPIFVTHQTLGDRWSWSWRAGDQARQSKEEKEVGRRI